MPNYASYQVDPSQAPPWLLGVWGSAWLSAMGASKDLLVGWCKEGVKARFATLCPSDALARLGLERGLARGPAETDMSYRARIQAAWTSWISAGTAWGLLYAFWVAGYPSVQAQTQGSGLQFSLISSPTGNPQTDLTVSYLQTPVHLGGTPAELGSDIGVLIGQPWPSWWGGSAPADGSADQKFASALIAQLKPAHSRCVFLKVVSGPTWDSGFFWDTSGKLWDQGTSVSWTPPAG